MQPTETEEHAMGIFSSIKDAIFGKKAVAKEPAPAAPAAAPQAAPAPAAPAAPVAISEVDVIGNLEAIAREKGVDLNWRTSIVDLMKLIGIDSSLSNREELAKELGYTGELGGSAEMNIWLHKAVMRELAKNGGKVPADLTD
jgi:3-oxoacyl-ACP reductase-like protein